MEHQASNPNGLLKNLNPAQEKAVLHPGGPALVVAGPGSGKTRVLTCRAAYLIREKSVPPENILLVTFTNKAAAEMKERVAHLLQSDHPSPHRSKISPLPWSGTFHSICARILRIEHRAAGLPINFIIYDDGDTKTLIRQIIKAHHLPLERLNPSGVAATISQAKDELVDENEFRRHAYGFFQQNTAIIYPLYQKALAKNEALDFADLIMKTVVLFQKEPTVLKKYQKQFVHILIDEYQDTNRAQYQLAKRLAEAHLEIFVVGDMSQAIYSFRGADYRNILNFEKDYPQAKVYSLEQNYRSTETIIKAARAMIKNNQSHVALDLWTENGEGDPIQLYEAGNERSEAEYVAAQIVENCRRPKNGRCLGLGDFAVLYRTNAQSRAVEEVLIRVGLPYKLVGGTKFYERKEIKDLLAYLRLLQNSEDSVSQERIEKLGKGRFQKFLRLAEKYPPEKVKGEATLIILEEILKAVSYIEFLDDGTAEGNSRIENVKELKSVATEFPDLSDFLENVALVQNDFLPGGARRLKDGTEEAITLMTLHAAKGLEFSVVFIVGLEEGLFPHARSLVDPAELEEERRLCYVGVTRARLRLHLTYCRRRLYFGTFQTNEPSRFLAEIPATLVESHTNNFE